MYDVDLGRLRRDLARLPASIAHAEAHGDARSADYLQRRLDRARQLAHRLGLYDHADPFPLTTR